MSRNNRDANKSPFDINALIRDLGSKDTPSDSITLKQGKEGGVEVTQKSVFEDNSLTPTTSPMIGLNDTRELVNPDPNARQGVEIGANTTTVDPTAGNQVVTNDGLNTSVFNPVENTLLGANNAAELVNQPVDTNNSTADQLVEGRGNQVKTNDGVNTDPLSDVFQPNPNSLLNPEDRKNILDDIGYTNRRANEKEITNSQIKEVMVNEAERINGAVETGTTKGKTIIDKTGGDGDSAVSGQAVDSSKAILASSPEGQQLLAGLEESAGDGAQGVASFMDGVEQTLADNPYMEDLLVSLTVLAGGMMFGVDTTVGVADYLANQEKQRIDDRDKKAQWRNTYTGESIETYMKSRNAEDLVKIPTATKVGKPDGYKFVAGERVPYYFADNSGNITLTLDGKTATLPSNNLKEYQQDFHSPDSIKKSLRLNAKTLSEQYTGGFSREDLNKAGFGDMSSQVTKMQGFLISEGLVSEYDLSNPDNALTGVMKEAMGDYIKVNMDRPDGFKIKGSPESYLKARVIRTDAAVGGIEEKLLLPIDESGNLLVNGSEKNNESLSNMKRIINNDFRDEMKQATGEEKATLDGMNQGQIMDHYRQYYQRFVDGNPKLATQMAEEARDLGVGVFNYWIENATPALLAEI